MDFSEVVRQIEQFIYELFMWVIFYPATLFRVVFRPSRMMDYVRGELMISPDVAFGSAIRPPLFLFLSIAIGSIIAPISAAQTLAFSEDAFGRWLTASWFNLLMFRTLGFSVYALVGALLFDWITPGSITRDTLKLPFYQQCYIVGPFALVLSPTLVRLDSGNGALLFVILALQLWLYVGQVLFFRRLAAAGWVKAMLLAGVVLLVGNLNLVLATLMASAFMG